MSWEACTFKVVKGAKVVSPTGLKLKYTPPSACRVAET